MLFLLPVVYTVQFVCVNYLDMPADERELHKHPLEKMLQDHFSPGVAAMALLTAVVLAPVFEELLFRGFLQDWLVATFDRLAAAFRQDVEPEDAPRDELFDPDLDAEPPQADPASDLVFWEAAEFEPEPESPSPPVPVASEGEAHPLAPVPIRHERGDRPDLAALRGGPRAAMARADPPVPARPGPRHRPPRTGSLLAPICMHAVFNGFSTLFLFFVVLHGPVGKKPEARPVLERPAPLEEAGTRPRRSARRRSSSRPIEKTARKRQSPPEFAGRGRCGLLQSWMSCKGARRAIPTVRWIAWMAYC